MRMVDLIEKKRDGGQLTTEEINWFVTNYTQGEIPDYQVSAFLMAVFYEDMSDEEITALTLAHIPEKSLIYLRLKESRLISIRPEASVIRRHSCWRH